MLLLDERILADGTHARTHALVHGDKIRIQDDDGTAGELSVGALDRVMTRYGRELDDAIALVGDVLELPGGFRLRRLRYHAAVDATGRDYLVWERPGADPLAAVGTMVTAALRYLVLRLAQEAPQESEGGGT
ncbi:MAG: hypothetical protein H0T46_08235 [Deltaproteobacteria bacterium]|nr:hypothetical protein [Deltaproteobacteria bacterium]